MMMHSTKVTPIGLVPANQRRRVLITAGPTFEPIDAVRFIGNRSSGRMGIAIATAFAARGHDVTLLLGPTSIQPDESSHLGTYRFRTTEDLERLLHEHWPRHDLLIMAAAVADFRLAAPDLRGKIARSSGKGLTLELAPTPDLLAGLRNLTQSHQRIIGFALEPRSAMIPRARSKLVGKGLHAIIANPLETMDSEQVEAVLITADGREMRPTTESGNEVTKSAFADWLAKTAEHLLPASNGP